MSDADSITVIETPATIRNDLTGRTFGKWTVLGFHCRKPRTLKGYTLFWCCRCECGNVVSVEGSSLTQGISRQCHPCAHQTHGMKGTKEYRSWLAMRTRCYWKKSKAYPRYGGRGIKVCERWRNSFEAFYADMGPIPDGPRVSLERKDNDGDYEPGNCVWATYQQQARNRVNTHMLKIDGVTKPLWKWMEESGVKRTTARERLKRGWSNKDAIFGRD